MSNFMAVLLAVCFFLLCIFLAVSTYVKGQIDDQYCRTISMERMDKIRCGIEKPKRIVEDSPG